MGADPMNADDHYVVISADCHGGGDDPRVPRLPRVAVPRRVRRVGRRRTRSCSPTCSATSASATGTPTGASRDLEADGIVAEVHLPEHDPAVLPERRAGHADPARRRARPRAAVGRAAGAQPLARRLLRAHTGPTRRHRADPPARRRRARSSEIRWAHGQRTHRRDPPPGAPPGVRAAAAVRASTTTRSGRCAKSSACRSTTTAGSAGPPRGMEQEDIGDVPARGHVVVAQRAHQPDRRRRARASSESAVRVHRAGHARGYPTSSANSTTSSTACSTRSARRSASGASRSSRRCR